VPPDVNFSRAMAPGFSFGADYWLGDGNLAITTQTRLTSEAVKIGDRLSSFTSWSSELGAKYKLNMLNFGQPYGLATLQRIQSTLFKIIEGEVVPNQKSIVGSRIGGGLLLELPSDIRLDVQVSELFNPYPIATHIGARGLYNIGTDLDFMGGLDMDLKRVDMTSGGIDVSVSELELGLVVGLSYSGL